MNIISGTIFTCYVKFHLFVVCLHSSTHDGIEHVSGDEMEVEDVASNRTADGGMSAGSDVETKDDTDMAEVNGKTENGEPAKVKRKFLNRRERKSLPSKEEIAQKRYGLNKEFSTIRQTSTYGIRL
jgi:hypothetical protein